MMPSRETRVSDVLHNHERDAFGNDYPVLGCEDGCDARDLDTRRNEQGLINRRREAQP